jgi:hypothetical protein
MRSFIGRHIGKAYKFYSRKGKVEVITNKPLLSIPD